MWQWRAAKRKQLSQRAEEEGPSLNIAYHMQIPIQKQLCSLTLESHFLSIPYSPTEDLCTQSSSCSKSGDVRSSNIYLCYVLQKPVILLFLYTLATCTANSTEIFMQLLWIVTNFCIKGNTPLKACLRAKTSNQGKVWVWIIHHSFFWVLFFSPLPFFVH